MINKSLIFLFAFYFLALFQTTFLVYFPIRGQIPNLIFIFLFLIIFFTFPEKEENLFSLGNLFPVLFSGFFMDLFSGFTIGVSIFLFFISVIVLGKILESIKEKNILVFLILFLIFELIFYFLLFLFNIFFKRNIVSFPNLFLIQISYDLFFALFFFIIISVFKQRKSLKKNYV